MISTRTIFIIIILIIILPVIIYWGYFNVLRKHEPFDSRQLTGGTKADSVVVFKSERKMILLKDRKEIKSYHISLGKNPIGRKEKEGDRKTPEGTYILDRRNPNSKYHLAIHISYPDENDRTFASNNGFTPGGDIMIHGFPNNLSILSDYYLNSDWTDGCIAVSNDEIEELWRVVDDDTPITINP